MSFKNSLDISKILFIPILNLYFILARSNHSTCSKIPLKNNQIDLPFFISHLEEYGVNNLLVEAGPNLTGSMIEAGYFDDVIIYIAPTLLGSDANNLVKLTQIKNIKQKIKFSFEDVRLIGPDLRVTLKAVKNDMD